MTSEVVAEIEAQVRELRASGRVPPGLEDELEACFEDVAEASLSGAGVQPIGETGPATPITGAAGPLSLAGLRRQATTLARRRLGPPLRRLERRSALGAARAGESVWTQAHVTLDRVERLAAGSVLASRFISAVRPRELAASAAGRTYPAMEGPLLNWVLERLSAARSHEVPGTPGPVLHTECGDGRFVEMLAARGLEARGADPRSSVRASGAGMIVAAGTLEYLAAARSESFDGLLLTGVVDRLRPGAARALAQLAARALAPGGVVVLVSARPEVAIAMDPVAADLAPGRPLHAVTWCHLLAHFGLCELAVFEPDQSAPEAREPDVFAVSARRPISRLAGVSGELS